MRHGLLLTVLITVTISAVGQSLKKLRDVQLPIAAKAISVDRLGAFYLISDCSIVKCNPEGQAIQQIQLKPCEPITALEAWGLARIFAYQNKKQQLVLLNPELEILEERTIEPTAALEPRLAIPCPDMNSYWVLDIDNTLRKFDATAGTITLETEALKTVATKITHLREYQNELFALDPPQGIFILNKMGELINKLPIPNINYFSFAGEDLYYLKDNQVHFYNLFNGDSYAVDVPAAYQFAVATDERLILIKDKQAEVFAFQPKQ